MPDPAPASVLFITGGLRHHAGDVDAAHAGATRSDHRCRPLAFGANGIRCDVRCGAGRCWNARTTDIGCGCGRPAPRAASTCPGWTTRCPTGASARRGRAVPRACSTTAERVWLRRGIAERLHLERFAVSKAAAHGQGGTVEFARSGKTVTVDAATPLMDAGEERRRPDAVRLPDGHLSVVCRRACSTGTSATCARAPNTNPEAGYRRAFPQHPAIAYSTFRLYWLVTYGVVGYGSVGRRKEAEQWQLPTYRHSRI